MRKPVLSIALFVGIVAAGAWLYHQSDAARGLVSALLGEHETAIQFYTKGITGGGLSPEYLAVIYRFRGDSYAALGDMKNALEDYDSGIRLDPSNADVYYKRATLHREAGRHEDAIADFSAVIDIKPGYGEAFRSRGLSYSELGEAARALQDYEKARELIPDDPVIKEKLETSGNPAPRN